MRIMPFPLFRKDKIESRQKATEPNDIEDEPIIRDLDSNLKHLLIVGAGGFGRVVLEYAEKDYQCAFIDDNVPIGSKVDDIEIIGKIKHLPLLSNYGNLIVAIGDNHVREYVYSTAKTLGFSFPNIISQSAYISPKSQIGNGCIILNNVVIQSGVHAGNGLILNPGVELHNDSFVDDYVLIYTNSVIRSNAHVGKKAWIGSTVTVSTCEVIPDDTVISDTRIKLKPKTFEELWGEVVATNRLPEMAIVVMHKSILPETKELLVKSRKSALEIADMLNRVIDKINRGSVARIDELIREEMG